MDEDAPQRRYPLREVFNALRWIVRAGAQWRMFPTNFPPWAVVYQQTQRWIAAGCFEAVVHDLRAVLRWADGRADDPTAVFLDSRTVQSTPESGARAGYDGYKRRKGSKTHAAVATLGHLLALHVTPANAQDRDQVAILAAAVQEATGDAVEIAFVDQGSTGRARRRTRRPTASGRRWSSCRRPSAGSCCCRAGGPWSAPSPGWRASVAWRGMTNACPKRLPACTSSPFLA
jgi:transposase